MNPARRFDHAGLEILDQDECLRLLQSVPLGRLVFTQGGLPAVRLVNFCIDGNTIVFASEDGEKYRAAERGDVVAFQADDIDVDRHLGWTVTSVGHLSVVPADEAFALEGAIPRHTWAPLRNKQLIRLGTESVTGRRLLAWGSR
jgi:nitroimidazol reductase NimA-like FMN-containing flavoprotein (pyridoxamine 5'-phosphate oxidase superfamily)